MARRLLAGLLLAAAVLALLLLLRARPSGDDAGVPAAPPGEPAGPVARVEALRAPLEGPGRARLSGPEPEAAAPASAAAPVPVAPAYTRIAGRVLEESTRAALEGAEVVFRRRAGLLTLACDEDGSFETSVDELGLALGESVVVSVRDAERRLRFRGPVVLQHEMILLAAAQLRLHGVVVLADGGSPQGLNLSIWLPAAGDDAVERFLGNDTIAADGGFAVIVSPVDVPAAFVLRVGSTGLPASVRVATEELTSPAGARVGVALGRLVVRVLDDASLPIASARVRFEPVAPPGGQALYAEATTGEDGLARVPVACGDVRVAAGAAGHAPQEVRVALGSGDSEVTLHLRRLTGGDVLRVEVAFDDGAPAPDALVTAWQASHAGENAVASMVQERTDARGVARLAVATDQPLTLYAFHKEHGESGEVGWSPGSGPARLVIQRGATVRVTGHGLPSGAASGGDIALVLVADDGRREALRTDALPVELSRVPPGAWRVYAVAEGLRAWASADLRVQAATPVEVTLEFTALGAVEGHVRAASGSRRGITVELAPSGWPDAASAELLRRPVAPDGSFRVPCPGGAGELRVLAGGTTLERRPARAGTPLEIVPPE